MALLYTGGGVCVCVCFGGVTQRIWVRCGHPLLLQLDWNSRYCLSIPQWHHLSILCGTLASPTPQLLSWHGDRISPWAHRPTSTVQANHYSGEWSNGGRHSSLCNEWLNATLWHDGDGEHKRCCSPLCIYKCCFMRMFALTPVPLLSPSFVFSCAAEKVSSLGKDWHKLCLKCDRCNKLLNAGGHAEVSKTPQRTEQGCPITTDIKCSWCISTNLSVE